MDHWNGSTSEISSGELASWAMDSANDPIIVIDRAGIVQGWNRACEALFGWTKAEAIGRDVDFMIPPKLREAHHRGFDAAIARGALASDGSSRRTRSLCADGTSVYIDMTFAMLTDPAGQVHGAVAVARGVSERDAPTRGRRRYRGPLVDVTFDSALCNHNGQCVANSPDVFNTAKRPWIDPTVASTEERAELLRTTVRNCPTGALQLLDPGAPDDPDLAG